MLQIGYSRARKDEILQKLDERINIEAISSRGRETTTNGIS
jgi:hypothetical protein